MDLFSKTSLYIHFETPEEEISLNKLEKILHPNFWITTTPHPFQVFESWDQEKSPTFKPNGTWFSKGDWLLHECSCINRYVTVIKVNPSMITTINDKNDLDVFVKRYGIQSLYLTAYQWKDVGLSGWAMPRNLFHPFPDICPGVRGFDVSSLVIWNHDCIEHLWSWDLGENGPFNITNDIIPLLTFLYNDEEHQ